MISRIILSQLRNSRFIRCNTKHISNYHASKFALESHRSESERDNGYREEGRNSNKSQWTDYITFGLKTSAALSSVFISYRTYSSSSDDNPPNDGDNLPPIVQDLQQAILEADIRRVQILAKKCSPSDINHRHRFGWQMLHLAAANGHSQICEILIQNGAKVNDIDNYSARLMAEKYQIDPLICQMVRETEFSPDLPRINFLGSTPLHYAALSNSLETVEVLKRYNANPMIKNASGHLPIKYANSRIAEDLAKYEEGYMRREKELDEEERRKYPLEQRIKDVIVGQENAITTVAATIRRKENGWFDDNHPLVFLFLGSSGIGKTELAKQVAKYLHKDKKDSFIRLDMSEYQEKHSVARMIGSPPGYVGYTDGGQLTDALRKSNNAVVLFDEVEKAHPQVLTVLLQLFDEGRLTDGKGQTIECKDAIFIMTSNLASEAIAQHATQLRAEQQAAKELRNENMLLLSAAAYKPDKKAESQHEEQITISRKFKDTIVRPILKAHLLRDEFLGRINEMVYFLPFSESELRQLVIKELQFWAEKAKEKNSLIMTWDDKVIDVICKGYDIHYGARSIKHEVERRIINQISELHHTVKNAKRVHVGVKEHDKENPDLITIKIT